MSTAGAAYGAASSSCLAFFFLLIATTSPWTLYNGLYLPGGATFAWFGVGPFVAGAMTNSYNWGGVSYVAGTVWWGDLNSKNVCENQALTKWYAPNNLCTADGTFVLPSESQAIQACVTLATIFSFMSCMSGFSLSKSRSSGGGVAACTSCLAMIFSIVAFAVWTTWGMSYRLRSSSTPEYGTNDTQPGDYVPVWVTSNAQYSLGTSAVPIRMYYGWTFVVTILSFVLLLFSTVTFSSVAKKLNEEEGGDFGKGI